MDAALRQRLAETRAQLTHAYQVRDQLFPKHDRKNTEEKSRLSESYRRILRSIPGTGFVPDQQLLKNVQGIAEEGIFICGYMKSGTMLLLELLDGHSQVIALPGDSEMVKRLAVRAALPYDHQLDAWSERCVAVMMNPRGQSPFWILGEGDDVYLIFLEYMDYLLRHLPPETRNLFLAFLFAYYAANPRRPSAPRLWVEKTPSNERKVHEILKWFPRARFLHILREPVAQFASLKRLFTLRGWEWDAEGMAASLKRSLDAGWSNRTELGPERYQVLRYECLTERTDEVMDGVARFLSIDAGETLHTPTINGLPSRSNSMHRGRLVSGRVAPAKYHHPKRVLTWRESRLAASLERATDMLCETG